jgi:hypothetical protein
MKYLPTGSTMSEDLPFRIIEPAARKKAEVLARNLFPGKRRKAAATETESIHDLK